jgi:RHH-type proline utilization regulon transcriptional repressor/proline dehydrogenase/delta 1-pyrroline-5-carboxylate dehydrogenase
VERLAGPDLVDEAVELVRSWVAAAARERTRAEAREATALRRLLDHPDGLSFLLGLTDRVSRPADAATAARHLRALVDRHGNAEFLPGPDRRALGLGAGLASLAPGVVVATAKRRLRSQVGGLVGDARPRALAEHLAEIRADGLGVNLNLLGEEVHGEAEAEARLARILHLMGRPDVDYVSVKASAVVGHLDPWAHRRDVRRLVEVLEHIYARSVDTDCFVNLDMESFRDLRLTIDAATEALDAHPRLAAGIVLQAYLPDAAPALAELAAFSAERVAAGGAPLKLRLVKGANLSMERVEAELRGWPQAPVASKPAADAAYLARIEQALGTTGLRLGVGSHNLFAIAHAHLLARRLGRTGDVDIEMLAGMAPAEARVVARDVGGVLLYVPVVEPEAFDAAIAYLVRRFEENAAPGHFLRVIDRLTEPGTFMAEDAAYRSAVRRGTDSLPPTNRTQDRTRPPVPATGAFANEPDTDPAAPANAEWVDGVRRLDPGPPVTELVADPSVVDERVAAARDAGRAWATLDPAARADAVARVGDELARRRAELVGAMVHEAGKPPAEADTEVSEAIDFARYYAERSRELSTVDGARFEAHGLVLVAAPWNFPVAIPSGGVLAALAAGSAVILKPAPETPRCAEVAIDAFRAAGVPDAVVSVLRTPDDETGRHLVTHPEVDAVVLTGSVETADLFRTWKPDIRLFGETSGKNAMVITPSADVDLAVADLTRSAFGHAGQKCSAASLAILVRPVDPRLRPALVDAVASLAVGDPTVDEVDVGLVIAEPRGPLRRGLTDLDEGERWLLEPRSLGPRTWTPGIRDGVAPGSWYARTECFGPVLGLVEVDSLDEAIAAQNASEFGLTGGIHSLDPTEVDRWVEQVEVGNAYVNRPTTGAIVRRQPFGGWKRSVVGPGAKAGGPNYVLQFGTWHPSKPPPTGPIHESARDLLDTIGDALSADDLDWLEGAAADDERWWEAEFGRDHDPSGLTVEANVFRYRPLHGAIRATGDGARDVVRVLLAARRVGIDPVVSVARPSPIARVLGIPVESADVFGSRLAEVRHGRARVIGPVEQEARAAAHHAHVEVVDGPVTPSGRLELRPFLREQAVSRTLHRYGTLPA